ncbi:MAG: histidine kinase [Ignavibacteria bacterium]|nr:histidine kinase [Ignavibacteria bacterium]
MEKNGRHDEVTDVIRQLGVTGGENGGRSLEFKDLMRYRINDILLVSSLYDFYTLVEDGQLTEAIFSEFLELNLHYAPHLTRVNSGEAALKALKGQRFDLVITMLRLGDMDLTSFCAAVKEQHADLPVVLIAYQSRELQLSLESDDFSLLDKVFIWTGDRKIFLAIIKLLEDLRNAPVDCLDFGVRTILLLEDSPAFYSSYLPLIFTDLINQGHSLIEEGKNFADRLLRQRARPKILHAVSFEEAVRYYDKYKSTLLGVITDMKVLKDHHETDDAGLQFARYVRGDNPEMPVLVQSSETQLRDDVEMEGFAFVNKNSRSLLQEVGEFIRQNFGFGDFLFRMPDGTVVNRARNLRDVREKLRYIPDESLTFHASRDHFSNWLMARTHFALAKKIKPVKLSHFSTTDDLRRFLIAEISQQLHMDQQGIISDFARGDYDVDAIFSRIGGGSLGGKARGLAFVDSMLNKYLEPDFFPGVRISIPRTVVLGSDVFAQFVEMNDLLPLAMENLPDEQILRAFLQADLPATVLGDLRAILQKVAFPLAVRSSSLLEDAMYQPFAGIYSTLMIPNSSADFAVRFHNLTQAIKFVFASTWFRGAKNYIEATGNRIEEERMAVIVQEMVGTKHDHFFYPHISGVARSFNYYPFGKATQKDGVVNLALGLGKTIVDGGVSLQFCPVYPTVHPQFGTMKDCLSNSQTKFWALDLTSDIMRKYPTEDEHLEHLHIQDAELHGTLQHIASTYSGENDTLYEGVWRKGPRVLNFAPILKSKVVPLTDILRLLVNICETAMNCPVEIEFAVRLSGKEALPAEFAFLQVRPMVKQESGVAMDLSAIPRENLLLKTSQALGNGTHRLRDIVYIKPAVFDFMKTRGMVKQISAINAQLAQEKRHYALIGPGRWGSSDPSLGIPVKFPDISAAQAIIETSLDNMIIDPSQGSHFFQNLTSFRIFYFTLRHYNAGEEIDWAWLDALPAVQETEHVRHVRLDDALEVIVDGQTGNGVVTRGGPAHRSPPQADAGVGLLTEVRRRRTQARSGPAHRSPPQADAGEEEGAEDSGVQA